MLDDSEIRVRRERQRERNRRYRLAHLDEVRARNREGERQRRESPEYREKLRAYRKRPDVQAHRREKRRAWMAIPENREKYRVARREQKRRARERANAAKAEAQRLFEIFNLAWAQLLSAQHVTDCEQDRDRFAAVVLAVAQGITKDPGVLARRAIKKFCGSA